MRGILIVMLSSAVYYMGVRLSFWHVIYKLFRYT